jgi:hypothetical protein
LRRIETRPHRPEPPPENLIPGRPWVKSVAAVEPPRR